MNVNMNDKLLYDILDIKYLEQNNRVIDYNKNLNNDLYPKDWILYDDYQMKCRILMEAIQEGKIIQDTAIYQSSFDNNRNIKN